jgi:antitoxin component YwqK of YwqJK toxin-antitoxin module
MKKEIIITVLLCACFKLGYSQYKLKDIPYRIDSINKSDKRGRQGVWFFYYRNDSTVIEMQNFLNDTLNGYFERYWYNGRVSEKGFYKNGLFDSSYIGYWENGKKRGEIFYRNGELDGIAVTYDQSENVTTRLRYINGKVDSTYESMYVDPTIEWDKQPSDVKRIDTLQTTFNSDWNKKYVIYTNDTLTAEINFFQNKIAIESLYEGGIIYKRIIYFKKAPGKIEKIFYFVNGELSSTEYYDKKGKVIRKENANKGIKK